MEEKLPNRSLTNWEKSDISLRNYKNFINRKNNKFELSIIDLLYISNFKGGNATVNEDEKILSIKLKKYSEIFIQIDKTFKNQTLSGISNIEYDKLREYIDQILELNQKNETEIDGFKSSFMSALLHSYFPNLIPILDRRVLINLDLVNEKNLYSSKQVKKIEDLYPKLIAKVREISKKTNRTIREIDKEYFIINLPKWAK